MALVAVGRDTKRAAFHRFQHQGAHLLNLFGRSFALHRLFPHRVVAHGDMAHQPADVNADFPF